MSSAAQGWEYSGLLVDREGSLGQHPTPKILEGECYEVENSRYAQDHQPDPIPILDILAASLRVGSGFDWWIMSGLGPPFFRKDIQRCP